MSLDNGRKDILLRQGIDQIFENLSNSHRRLILLLLKQGRIKTETDVMVRGGNNSTEAELALIHNHLPRLDDAGYIEWERDSGDISKGPRFEEIEPLLELIETHADELPADWP
ncbi:DUF7344 domain-containing protein [Halovenus amylolytica]|uniref:DUF7344 domain-containing protein n=1 Tax=Halovenus amylolytica TaxID=2500550 RepID=UPI00360C86FE